MAYTSHPVLFLIHLLMQLYNDIPIPKYPLEPDAKIGNTMFRINRNDSVMNYRLSDFLVPHRKDYYFMVLVGKGDSRHWIDMTPYTLKPNTFYFTVPHQVHLKEETKPLSGVSLSFTKEFLATDSDGVLKELPIIKNPNNGHELSLNAQNLIFIEDILDKLYNEYQTKSAWQHTMLLSYTKVLLVYLSRLYTEQFAESKAEPGKELLKKYLAQIERHYTKLHEVSDYANLLHISSGHLSEVVKEQTGKSAITHIHERLILEAKRLLFHTEYAIKGIAYHLGFEDASYFARFFKRITGHTPLFYRENFREMYH